MAREGDNDNDEYYVLIQTGLNRRIVKPNFFTSNRNSTWYFNFPMQCFLRNFMASINRNHQKIIGKCINI